MLWGEAGLPELSGWLERYGGNCCCRSTLGLVRLLEMLLILASGAGLRENFMHVRSLSAASLRPWRLQQKVCMQKWKADTCRLSAALSGMRYCGKQPHLVPQRPSAVLSGQSPRAKRSIWKFGSSTKRAGEWERPQDRLSCECWEGQIIWAVPLVWKSEEHTGWIESVWSTDFLAVHQIDLIHSAHYFFRY